MRIFAVLLALALSVAAGAADACSRHVTPAQQASGLLAYFGPFDAEIEVRVTAVSAMPLGGWRATGRQLRTASGSAEAAQFQFGEAERVVSSCGPVYAPAQVGEAWVLYFRGGDRKTPTIFLPSALLVEMLGQEPKIPLGLPRAVEPGVVEGLTPMPAITPPR